jgi:hypothetical protein
MSGLVSRRRAEEFARLADLAVDRPGAEVAKQLALDEDGARLVSVARALREVRIDAGPDPEFRDRLRRRLVAVASVNPPVAAASILARPDAVPAPRSVPKAPLVGVRGRNPRLAFLAGAMAALVTVTGLTLLASHKALPGDTLYSVKRSSEHLELALLHDPQERGLRQLGFAQTRLEEIGQLLSREGGISIGQHTRTVAGGGGLASGDADLVLRALTDMDDDTREGASLITTAATQKRADAPLVTLATWTVGQQSTLSAIAQHLPATPQQRAVASLKLLTDLSTRIGQLRRDLQCGCLDRNVHDDLGPLPCAAACPSPGGPGTPGGGTGAPGSATGAPGGGTTTGPAPPASGGAASTAPPATPTTPGPTPTATLPSVPPTTTSPTLCQFLHLC